MSAPLLTGPEGILVVDKPAGMTSHDVVQRVRRLARTRKVGHAGTLDPMATGVLILGLGRATRLLGHLALHDKDYTATIRLGQDTFTDDAEGDITTSRGALDVSDAAIESGVAALTGEIQQVPSAISAIKVDGQRSYARARKGEQVELAARSVTVSRFEVRAIRRVRLAAAGDVPECDVVDLDVEVTCSTGTYVRALARDLGHALGCGGHLTSLRRTRVGGFTVDLAQDLSDDLDPGDVLIGLHDALVRSFPRLVVDAPTAVLVRNGRRLSVPDQVLLPDGAEVARIEPPLALVSADGEALGLMEPRDGELRPVLVFA